MPRNRNAITYRSYRQSSLHRRLRDLLARGESINSYLADVYALQTRYHAVGFKLMYGQADRFPEVVDWCYQNNVRVVHLVRRNSLKMIVSRQIAAKRGVYLSNKPVKPVSINLNVRRLKSQLRRADELVDANRRRFASLPYVEVVYEDFLADQASHLRRILEFLECESGVPLASDLVKTSPDSLEMLIDNYDDVRRALAGTAFEAHLG